MNKIKALAIVVIGLLATVTISTALTPVPPPNYAYEKVPLSLGKISSLVRLQSKDGRFFCSGSVISNKYVLTAAHCIMDMNGGMFGGPPAMNPDPIQVVSDVSSNPVVVKVWAKAKAGNPRADYGVIVGDFSRFEKAKLNLKSTLMYDVLKSKSIEVCGFPYGAASVCYPAKVRSKGLMKIFQFSFDTFLYPGMSGGPVVDRESGLVFAVNSNVDEDNSNVAPIVGLIESLGLKESDIP